jgi:hypothetical protein
MSEMHDHKPHRTYLIGIGLTWILICSTAFAVNLFVDPLWFWKGNQVSGVNLRFNEREAKLNHVLAHPTRYDCLIFGSSRATIFQPDSLPGYRCFNLAFSSGQVSEFIAIGRYISGMGIAPRLVVVGIDGFGFYDEGRDPVEIPAFVLANTRPPGILTRYFSADTLWFSLLTISDAARHYRVYDSEFRAVIRANAPPFRPNVTLQAEGLQRANDAARQRRRFNPAHAALYGEFRKVFPQARFLAYVPPISAWHIERFSRHGVLDGYVAALHACAQYFEAFWDFSVPSARTWDVANTYDGSHYSVAVNREIARVLTGGPGDGFGVRVSGLDLAAHRSAYVSGLERFRQIEAQLLAGSKSLGSAAASLSAPGGSAPDSGTLVPFGDSRSP